MINCKDSLRRQKCSYLLTYFDYVVVDERSSREVELLKELRCGASYTYVAC